MPSISMEVALSLMGRICFDRWVYRLSFYSVSGSPVSSVFLLGSLEQFRWVLQVVWIGFLCEDCAICDADPWGLDLFQELKIRICSRSLSPVLQGRAEHF